MAGDALPVAMFLSLLRFQNHGIDQKLTRWGSIRFGECFCSQRSPSPIVRENYKFNWLQMLMIQNGENPRRLKEPLTLLPFHHLLWWNLLPNIEQDRNWYGEFKSGKNLNFAISAPELWGFLVDKFILVQTCDVKSLDRKWNYPQERGNLYKKVLKMD